MTSWIGRRQHRFIGLAAAFCMAAMTALAPPVTATITANGSVSNPTKQYRLYVSHISPLFTALHQAETLLERPETLTLQRWSAWLGGWDGHYQAVMQQAKESHFGTVRHYRSYHQLQQTHAVLHQVQQRMQQEYLGLPSNSQANTQTMDRAYEQVQQCLALEDTLQPLLYNSQTGRR